jgi:hypothetical protein
MSRPTWTDLFDRAQSYEVTTDQIRASLRARRDDG